MAHPHFREWGSRGSQVAAWRRPVKQANPWNQNDGDSQPSGNTGSRWAQDRSKRCDAMLGPPGVRGAQPDWLLRAEKCMEPATVVMAFWCENGHSGEILKCDAHSRADGTQICGYCAEMGRRIPTAVRVVRRL